MKRAVIGLACAAGLAGTAMAADLGVPSAPVPAWSWSGGYLGLHGGWAFGNADLSFDTGDRGPWTDSGISQDVDGGVFGLHTGWNWQIGSLVLGLEGTTAWTGIEGKDTISGLFSKTEVENLSTFVARLGVANGPWLLYGKGGIAYGTVKSTLADDEGYFREKTDHVGWTVGAGLDYALTPNWILGIEYNYVDLGDQRYGGLGYNAYADYTGDITVSTVLARLSYKFGAGGNPITAAILGPANGGGLWNGLYLGVHGGYGWGTADQTLFWSDGPVVLADAFDHDVDGGVLGGQVGYMTQFGNWVIGTEATLAWTGLKKTVDLPYGLLGPWGGASATSELDWLATVTLRAGYSWGPWLVYGKGGTAVGAVDSRHVFDDGQARFTFAETNDHIGWTLGGGVEYAWGNWLVGVEYNYVDLGDQHYGGFANYGVVAYETDLTLSTVLARLSYRFGAPAPVAAVAARY